MTRKEAIKWLEYSKQGEIGKAVEAADIAIKALEQEPVLDKIRAEISSLIAEYDARCERFHHKPYKPTKGIAESDVAPRSPKEIESNKWGERAEGLERALKIIDKHMNGKESEGAE